MMRPLFQNNIKISQKSSRLMRSVCFTTYQLTPRTEGRIIGVSVQMCVFFVCLWAQNEQFERNRAVYEPYESELENISFYMPHERESTSGSQEKQTFGFFKSSFCNNWTILSTVD